MTKTASAMEGVAGPLGIEQLEAALRQLNRADVDPGDYWDKHIEAFRQTVLLAIHETSGAINRPSIPRRWRIELERQLVLLDRYIELADRYLTMRSIGREPLTPASPRSPRAIQ